MVPKYTRSGGRIWWIFPEQQIIENSRNFCNLLNFWSPITERLAIDPRQLAHKDIFPFLLPPSPHPVSLFSLFKFFLLFFPLLPTELLSQTLSLENFPWLAFSFVLKIQTPHTFLDANEVQGKKSYVPKPLLEVKGGEASNRLLSHSQFTHSPKNRWW